jgi:hypothetical protein
MPKLISKLLLSVLVGGFCCLLAIQSGCGGNPNEAEYNRTTSPGTPAEPESVAARKARTSNLVPAPTKNKGRNVEKAPKGGG